MPTRYYETERAASEYLLLHYGTSRELLPPGFGKPGLANFPVRCVAQCLNVRRLPVKARALDLGCAVGRSTFELARHCHKVIGIDYSKRFIQIANQLRTRGSLAFDYVEEGRLTRPSRAAVPASISRKRASFRQGDALEVSRNLGSFDVVLMANLIDRLSHPRKCLEQLPRLLNPGGQLIITSPYTWLPEYTAPSEWLGGFVQRGKPVLTFATITEILSPHFELRLRRDLPFVIREHARKFQLGVAEASVWQRK
jgi:putative 4-mercaptohistidine N1-methyltranferase